jgi:hypothetical protein
LIFEWKEVFSVGFIKNPLFILIGKRLHPWVLKFSLLVSVLLISDVAVFSQTQNTSTPKSTSDTNSIKKQGVFGFIKHLLHPTEKKSTSNSGQNKGKGKTDTVASKNNHKPESIELTKGSVSWTSLYTQGVNLNTGVNGLYTLGRLSQGFDVYGAPITGQGIGVFNDGRFEKSYSSYSVNFDAEMFLNGLRKRAENILLNKRTMGKAPNLSDSLNAYESLREKLQSPSYQAEENTNKSQFKKEQDSLSKHPGSDTAELHSLRKKLYLYSQLEKRYQQLFAIKKNANSLEKADTAKRKYEQEEKALNNPSNIEKLLLENHQLSGFEKLLMGVQKFSIGQSGEEISEFTFHNFMMNGVNVGYKSGDMYNYVGYGKVVAVVNPFLMTGIAVPNYNRTVEFVRTGEGTENGPNLYATIIKIADPGSSTSLNESNWVFDLTKNIAIGKNVDIEAELAKSTYSYTKATSDTISLPFSPQDNNSFAFAVRGKGTIPGINTTVKSEFSQTGGDFVTLGNPYLISGANKYEIDLTQPISKKLLVNVGGTHIVENTASSDGTKGIDNWVQFSVLFKPTSLINMEFKYAPLQFQQESGTIYANSLTNNISQISFTGSISSRIFEKNSTTSIFAGNFQYNTAEVSQLLSQNLNLSYYMINELFIISSTQGINISVDESRNNWTGTLSQFIGQSMYNWNLKKALTVALGPEWIEQPGVIPNELGVVSSLSSSVQKWGRLGVELTYRNNAEKPFGNSPQYLISGNVTILW